jgi:hypothetical protein
MIFDGRQSVKNEITAFTYSDHPTRDGFWHTMHSTSGSVGAKNQSRWYGLVYHRCRPSVALVM